jgi:tRNA (guanine37-N1)-methyltransferase
VEDLAHRDDLILLCGHYEGIDQRVLDEIVTEEISVGDYVLTGGELPALILIDAVARMIPGVLHNDGSTEAESFSEGLLEYPQYTRPEIWHDKQVPEVLLSGHHKNISEWRKQESLKRTEERRPDILEKFKLNAKFGDK